MSNSVPEGSAPNDTTIDLAKVRAALAQPGESLGICQAFAQLQPRFDIHIFDSLPSTSTYLWELAAAGKAGPGTVVIAREQSSGRGQRGRSWYSQPGGLYLSLLLEPDMLATHSAQLTCLSAWGIATALNNLGLPIQIKWPNDLFFRGQKVGGILTETRVSQLPDESTGVESGLNPSARITQAVIGIGINWHNPTPQTGITLSQVIEEMARSNSNPKINKINCLEVLTALVLKGILQGVFFQQRVGSQVFMKAYRKLLTQYGDVVSLGSDLSALAVPLTPSEQSFSADFTASELKKRSGKVVGLSEEGYLQVALQGSTKPVAATSVVDEALEKAIARNNIVLLRPSTVYIS